MFYGKFLFDALLLRYSKVNYGTSIMKGQALCNGIMEWIFVDISSDIAFRGKSFK